MDSQKMIKDARVQISLRDKSHSGAHLLTLTNAYAGKESEFVERIREYTAGDTRVEAMEAPPLGRNTPPSP